jgi:predicted metal-dependent HD superfamily phosphohydrolase
MSVARWLSTLPGHWIEGCPEAVFVAAREAYDSPGRFYHTWDHVLDCVETLRTMPCDAPRTVFLALVFHDAVYVAGRPDNEALSAELASRTLEEHATVPVSELARIYRIIVATRSHVPAPGASHDLRVALDIDMSILGAPADRYDAYARDVRREYCPAVVDEAGFARGRGEFLSELLASEAIFATPQGKDRWEARARENIARELAGIR